MENPNNFSREFFVRDNSVATTTHAAPISAGTTMVESSFDIQPAAIATNTTNLINININNSGNITAVATGENHQINKCYRYIAHCLFTF